MESGPSFNVVLGGRASRAWVRGAVGDRDPFRPGAVVSVDGIGFVGLPDIMDSHTESTSIVEAAVFTNGFFSTFLLAESVSN
jgi:hypothetical protein